MTVAALYLRMSLDRTGDALGVARQEEACRAYAEARGITVGRVYVDNDFSATAGRERPAFERLLADKPAAVIVWHQDRLLRVSRDLERVLKAGLAVHQVTAGSLDLASPTGRAVARTITAWTTYEGEHKAERQRASLRQRAAAGDSWWTHRPFGYEMDLSLRPDEAAHLRQAYQDLLAGKSSYAIAKAWNAAGVKMPESPNPWQGRRVSDLLRQPRNAGMATYKGEVVGQGKWAPIVDQGTFYAALAVLSDPARRVGGAPRYSLLSGVLRCGRCGGAMARWRGTRKSGTTFDRYRCSGCQFIVDTAWAEAQVREQFVASYVDGRIGDASQAQVDHSDQIESLTTRLTDLAEAYAAETVTLAQLTAGTQAIQRRIDTLRQEAAQQAVQYVVRNSTREDGISTWEQMDTDERRERLAKMWVIWAVKNETGIKQLRYSPVATMGGVTMRVR